MLNSFFSVCRLTAGRTPPTPHWLPPLPVLLVVSTPTLPTDLVALLTFPSFPLRSSLITIVCPYFSHLPRQQATRSCKHFSRTHAVLEPRTAVQ